MADTTFNIDFGNGFSVRQSKGRSTDNFEASGSFHRLTPDQFDALIDTFEVTKDDRVLSTDGRYGAPRNFRTANINFGGLDLTIFSDIPAEVGTEFLPIN